jgi:hypothetical protein
MTCRIRISSLLNRYDVTVDFGEDLLDGAPDDDDGDDVDELFAADYSHLKGKSARRAVADNASGHGGDAERASGENGGGAEGNSAAYSATALLAAMGITVKKKPKKNRLIVPGDLVEVTTTTTPLSAFTLWRRRSRDPSRPPARRRPRRPSRRFERVDGSALDSMLRAHARERASPSARIGAARKRVGAVLHRSRGGDHLVDVWKAMLAARSRRSDPAHQNTSDGS